ncbi:MAG: TIGR03936 family radical SAM-associated protein, partial [Myxococcota bacterium]|nr:TIGR03936 family radical SAM-associated protein [Myxococcota bacterium]
HLETMNAWMRALRRSRAVLAYSQGFHPHPKLAFAGARPVAEESLGDHMDVILTQRVDPGVLLARLQATVPLGFRVLGVQEVGLKSPSLMSAVAGADYLFLVDDPPDDLPTRVERLLGAETLPAERRLKAKKRKRGRRRGPATRTIDLRPNVRSIRVAAPGIASPVAVLDGQAVLEVSLDVVDGRGARPSEIMTQLALEHAAVRVVRLRTRFRPGTPLGPDAEPSQESRAATVSSEAPAASPTPSA